MKAVQSAVPALYYDLGKFLFDRKNHGVLSVRATLKKRYPSSAARGRLEELLGRR